jgi:hypothetical protein
MLDTDTKRRIDTARDILVGKVPDPKSQVEQITIALIYKFMDDMDAESEELGGKRKFFTGDYARYGWAKLMAPSLGGHEMLGLYGEGIAKMPENPGIPPLFRDIFKNAYLPYRDPETLKAFLKIIDEFSYDHSERLGDAFEYLLSPFSAARAMPASSAPRATSSTSWSKSSPRRKRDHPRPRLRHRRLPHLRLQAHPAQQHRRQGPQQRSRPTTRAASPRTSRATTSRPTWCASRW